MPPICNQISPSGAMIIHLPIIGSPETLRWSVWGWGSLSRDNFQILMDMNDDPSAWNYHQCSPG